MEYECTPEKEIQSRISLFQRSLRVLNIDGALISQNIDLFYFSGTIQPSYLFVPADGNPLLAVVENIDRARRESSLSLIVKLDHVNQLDQILSGYHKSIQGRIGLEMDVLPVNLYFKLSRSFPKATFIDVSEAIKKIRMIKSEYEILQIKKATDILNNLMNKAQNNISVGMTELDVDAMLYLSARRSGHQGQLRMRRYNQEILNAYVFCGKTGAMPSLLKGPLGGLGTTPAVAQGASFNKIESNKPVIVDFGVGINGYLTDMTRTFVVGQLSGYLIRSYNFLKDIKRYLEDWVRPGKSCSLLYIEIIDLVARNGYQDYFMGFKGHQMPFVGHGIGLELDEYPLIGTGFNEEFQENMVFAFEPKLVFPDIGAIGLEDDFRVTNNGLECLTTYDDGILTVSSAFIR